MFRGDANDLVHVERVRSYADPKALVIACLDPATPDLRWTNGNRASRFRVIGFISNMPFSGIHHGGRRRVSTAGRAWARRMTQNGGPTGKLEAGAEPGL